MVSDHPLRRRDNGRSAVAASKAIRSPIYTTPNARPTPQGFVGQLEIMQPEVRHNRDKRGCSSLLPFGNPDPLVQTLNALTIRRFGADGMKSPPPAWFQRNLSGRRCPSHGLTSRGLLAPPHPGPI
jgi:hypothetical protein